VTPFNGGGSRNGQAVNTTNDGIVDWGSPSLGNFSDPKWMSATEGLYESGNGSIGAPVNANTWEFKIATFTLNMGNLGSGTTRFNVINGNTGAAFGSSYVTAKMDGVISTLFTNTPGDTFTSSQGVSLVVPEVAGLAMLGSASIGLLARIP